MRPKRAARRRAAERRRTGKCSIFNAQCSMFNLLKLGERGERGERGRVLTRLTFREGAEFSPRACTAVFLTVCSGCDGEKAGVEIGGRHLLSGVLRMEGGSTMSLAEWASLILPILAIVFMEVFIERPRHKQS